MDLKSAESEKSITTTSGGTTPHSAVDPKSEEPVEGDPTNQAGDVQAADDPRKWPIWKKAYHTAATGALAFAVTSGTSMITPAIPEVAKEFDISEEKALLTLSLYTLGLAFGPMIAAPISETWGRSVVYKVTGLVSILFLIGGSFSKTIAGLLACRLLAGMSGGPVLAVGAGTSADMYAPHYRALASSTFVMMPFLGPSIGPIIGGFVAVYKGWRWTQFCTIFIFVLAYALVLPMKETYAKIILARYNKKHAKHVTEKLSQEASDNHNSSTAWAKQLFTVTLIRPVHMLLMEPIVLVFSLYNGFTFAVLFALFTAYPYSFETVYGFNTWQTGLAFIGIMVGVILAHTTVVLIDRLIYFRKYKKALSRGHSMLAPEHRLYAGMIGSIGVTVGLFWLAWTIRSSVPWIVPILAGIPFAWGNLTIFLSGSLYLIDVYGPRLGASAFAANGLLRYTMGAVFPLFTVQMYRGLGIAWATSLLGFVSILLLPIPWVLFRYGPSIRKRSGYDTAQF